VDRLAIFDLDNTLVDRSAAFASWAATFTERWGLGPEALVWLIEEDGDGFAVRRTVFERARNRFGLAASVDQLVADYSPDYLSRFRPDPAVQDGLARLKDAGWRLAVATNGAPTQHAKIENAGLAPWLDAVCVSEELGFAKPDRRIFEAACSAAGLGRAALGRGWMIGDSAAADIRGAHEIGMRSVWLHRGRAWTEAAFRPDAVVASIDRAVEHLLANG